MKKNGLEQGYDLEMLYWLIVSTVSIDNITVQTLDQNNVYVFDRKEVDNFRMKVLKNGPKKKRR